MRQRGGSRDSTEITRAAIERALTAHALRCEGLTLDQVGERMGGVTRETARQAILKGERIIATRYKALNECAALIQTLDPARILT